MLAKVGELIVALRQQPGCERASNALDEQLAFSAVMQAVVAEGLMMIL